MIEDESIVMPVRRSNVTDNAERVHADLAYHATAREMHEYQVASTNNTSNYRERKFV
jgi:hypothetical protein